MEVLYYILNAFSLGVTFLYGCTGEIITEKSGHLNLGIPGIMCIGSATGCAALQMMYKKGIPDFLVVIISIIAAFIGGAIMGAIYSFITVTLKSNQNVTGLVMTIFGVGLTNYIMHDLTGVRYLYAKKFFRFPFAESKTSLQYCGVMVFLAIIIAIIASYILTKTRIGLNLRSVGENPATADAAGINVSKYRYLATIIGSGIAALGGLFYVMDYSGTQEAYLSIEAMGWLSVALVIFSTWKPIVGILGSFIFGVTMIAGSFLPIIFSWLTMASTPFLKMLPYVITIIVLIITSIRNKRENQPPEKLGINYFREDR
ncbi:MAG: ABC transporter permease [Clostridia bacterium]|nr:ABC transporter permease [Clostridia bacterium]